MRSFSSGAVGRVTPHATLIGLLLCGGLLVIFATLSLTAVRTKSPVFDEPMHAVSAWTHLRLGDFRMSFEESAALALLGRASERARRPQGGPRGGQWASMLGDDNVEWRFTYDTLYATPGNDAASFIDHSRPMMLMLGVFVGVIIAVWSWQLAGGWAAVIAVLFFGFDPNFLAHSPLLKGDVPFTLVMVSSVYAVWRLGRKGHGSRMS